MYEVECGILPPHISAVCGLFFSLCFPSCFVRCPCAVSNLHNYTERPCARPFLSSQCLWVQPSSSWAGTLLRAQPEILSPSSEVGLMGVMTADQSRESQLEPQQKPPGGLTAQQVGAGPEGARLHC